MHSCINFICIRSCSLSFVTSFAFWRCSLFQIWLCNAHLLALAKCECTNVTEPTIDLFSGIILAGFHSYAHLVLPSMRNFWSICQLWVTFPSWRSACIPLSKHTATPKRTLLEILFRQVKTQPWPWQLQKREFSQITAKLAIWCTKKEQQH